MLMAAGILGNSWLTLVVAFVAVLAIRAAFEYSRGKDRDAK
jgi:hypothetical protein